MLAEPLLPLAERASNELGGWGHAGHVGCDATLERAILFLGDPGALGCAFWCESRHATQPVLLERPEGD